MLVKPIKSYRVAILNGNPKKKNMENLEFEILEKKNGKNVEFEKLKK